MYIYIYICMPNIHILSTYIQIQYMNIYCSLYVYIYIYSGIHIFLCLDIWTCFPPGRPAPRNESSQAQALATSGLWRRGDLEEVLDARLQDSVDTWYSYDISTRHIYMYIYLHVPIHVHI